MKTERYALARKVSEITKLSPRNALRRLPILEKLGILSSVLEGKELYVKIAASYLCNPLDYSTDDRAELVNQVLTTGVLPERELKIHRDDSKIKKKKYVRPHDDKCVDRADMMGCMLWAIKKIGSIEVAREVFEGCEIALGQKQKQRITS